MTPNGVAASGSRDYNFTATRPNQLYVPAGHSHGIQHGANTHLLSATLAQAALQSTWKFAQKVLAKPLGFSLAPENGAGLATFSRRPRL